jgi:hypothetical protein
MTNQELVLSLEDQKKKTIEIMTACCVSNELIENSVVKIDREIYKIRHGASADTEMRIRFIDREIEIRGLSGKEAWAKVVKILGVEKVQAEFPKWFKSQPDDPSCIHLDTHCYLLSYYSNQQKKMKIERMGERFGEKIEVILRVRGLKGSAS